MWVHICDNYLCDQFLLISNVVNYIDNSKSNRRNKCEFLYVSVLQILRCPRPSPVPFHPMLCQSLSLASLSCSILLVKMVVHSGLVATVTS